MLPLHKLQIQVFRKYFYPLTNYQKTYNIDERYSVTIGNTPENGIKICDNINFNYNHFTLCRFTKKIVSNNHLKGEIPKNIIFKAFKIVYALNVCNH